MGHTKLRWAKARLPALLIVTALLAACSASGPQKADLLGHPAPVVRFTTMDGEYRGGYEFRGKTQAVLFWATTCSKSKRTVKDFDRLAERFSARKDLTFVAVSIDKLEDREEVLNKIQESKLSHVIHAFSGNDVSDEAYYLLRGDSIPYLVLIGPDGVVRAVTESVGDIEEQL